MFKHENEINRFEMQNVEGAHKVSIITDYLSCSYLTHTKSVRRFGLRYV